MRYLKVYSCVTCRLRQTNAEGIHRVKINDYCFLTKLGVSCYEYKEAGILFRNANTYVGTFPKHCPLKAIRRFRRRKS